MHNTHAQEGCEESKDRSDYEVSINQLRRAIGELESLVLELGDRIKPVLNPETEHREGPEKVGQIMQAKAPCLEDIDGCRRRVDLVKSTILGYHERLVL